MALTPEQIDGLRARMEDIAQPIIDWLLADIAERVAEAGKMTSTAAYEAYRAQALGASREQLEKFLKKQLGISEKELEQLFEQAAKFSSEDDFARVGVWATEAQQESLEQMVKAAIQLATKDFENLTQTMGMVDCITGRPLPLQDAYRQAMDFAFGQIFTGAADYETAIRQATRKLASRGVVAIDYASGVSTELGAAVRRNMMGGMGLLVEQITQANHDALGCDGWEISAHAASAPDHEPYQGRQYSDAEYTRLNEETLKRRIGTLNCGHYPSPIILGVNSPQYTEAELEEFRRANAEGITYEGKHYTAYEATQQRNRIESGIRRQKRRVLVSEKSGDADQLLTDRIKLARLNQEYSRFCKAADLKTRPQRLQQDGFGRRQAAQAGAAGRKHLKTIAETNSGPNTKANLAYIESENYRRAFDGIFKKDKLNSEVCRQTRKAIRLNDGRQTENYAFIFEDGSKVITGKSGAFGGSIDGSCLSGKATAVWFLHIITLYPVRSVLMILNCCSKRQKSGL
ncbi:MAG TPA: phage minor capsid protein [Candidatus Anaerofilum faecale]|nr:phage minor capsid protein [Candidatus Anaerofilum faecale]